MKQDKKTILIFGLSRKPWIGGIYYRKNIINLLLKSDKIINNYDIVLVINNKNKHIFDIFKDKIKIISCNDDIGIIRACVIGLKCITKYKIKYVFPIKPYSFFKMLGIIPISWIADFQHCYYPEFFDEREINERNNNFSIIANSNNPLVLSSNSCADDLKKFYNPNRSNVFVVPFASCIDDEIAKINEELTNEVFNKYNIKKNQYIAICNQFWKHKNHKIVFEAINILKNDKEYCNIKFVFTGELSDWRNPEYINKLKEYITENELNNKIIITGFINRTDQLIIMKNSLFIIQPSLFEGWGTVVEDAKVLNKRILLSDIPVHKEQANDKCTLFDPTNINDLLNKIKELIDIKDEGNIANDMSYNYSMKLEKVFVDEK